MFAFNKFNTIMDYGRKLIMEIIFNSLKEYCNNQANFRI